MHLHFGVTFAEELLAAFIFVPLAVHVARVAALFLRLIVDLELVEFTLSSWAKVSVGIVIVLFLLHDRRDVHYLD